MPLHKDTQDLYNAIHSVKDICTRLEATLDVVIKTQDDHEQRIRTSEKWRWTHLASLPGIGSLFTHLIK